MNSELPAAGFLRHVSACQSATLPGGFLPFRIADPVAGCVQVGWVQPALADRLERCPDVTRDAAGVTLSSPASLPGMAAALAEEEFYRFRNELFDVRVHPGDPPVAQIDRGAVPSFGVMAQGVHVNGLVRRADGLHVWVARRAADKLLDPNKLDHIVAGGVPAGYSPLETLVKEAAEEASIPAELARQARPVGTIAYAMDRPEGLRRDYLHCWDLLLPDEFVPHGADGEVAGFELWSIQQAADRIATSDDFKFNVNLVMIDLFIRVGVVSGEVAATLRRALDAATV